MAGISLFVWWKKMYFLGLYPGFAPLIRTIWQCMIEVRHFMMVTTIIMGSFAQAFYFLAFNQIQFDQLAEDDKPPYSSAFGAFTYTYYLILGEMQTNEFAVGTNGNLYILWIVFAMATFAGIILLFNMLVALLNETQARNSEKSAQIAQVEQLSFVVDNFFLTPLSRERGKKISYICAAFNNN